MFPSTHNFVLAQKNVVIPTLPLQQVMFAAIVIVLLCVPLFVIFQIFRYCEKSREMKHQERIKAIEQGVNADNINTGENDVVEQLIVHNALWIAFWVMLLGAATPFMSATAYLTEAKVDDVRVTIAALAAAGCAGVVASISTCILVGSAWARTGQKVQQKTESKTQ